MRGVSQSDESKTESLAARPATYHPVVHLVDDDPKFVRYLASILGSAEIEALIYEDGVDFLQRYAPRSPECLVLDLRMPGLSGLGVQDRLEQDGVPIPIVFLTANADIPLAVEAMKRGAFDYLEKPCSTELVLGTVRRAIEEDRTTRRKAQHRADAVQRVQRLTGREREVLEHVLAGRPSKVIATELGIAKKTVDLHRSNLMRKLEAGSVIELVQLASAAGVSLRDA